MESNRDSIMFDPNDIVNESFHSRFSTVKFKERPVSLIEFGENKLVINPEAMALLRSIEEEIIVVSAVGKAKTGKSYLLNLLVDANNGFPVGSSTNACTKGMWMWGNYRDNRAGNSKIIFIDTEGLSTLGSTKTNDAKIFALIVLISSIMLYNSDSNIDGQGISELSLISELANSISMNAKIDKDAFITESSPKFLWILRDFALTKVDPDTNLEISAKEYLEICLRNKVRINYIYVFTLIKELNNSVNVNLIRDLIIKYFPDRDCCTLVRPIDNESDLKRLNQISKDNLNTEFLTELEILKNKIYKESYSKKIKGKKCNGSSLALLIEEWVDAINRGAVPNISTILDHIINNDIKEFHEKALKSYLAKLDTLKNVMEQEEIVRRLYDFKLEAMMRFNQIFNFDQDTFNNSQYLAKYNEKKRVLEAEISKCESKLMDKNLKESSSYCTDLLQESYEVIDEKISSSYYNVKTCDEYLKDHEKFINNYSNNSKGPDKVKDLVEFISEKKPIFIEAFIAAIQKENNEKLNQLTSTLTRNEETKKEAIEKNRQYTDNAENLNGKIADLNSELEKKKRENVEMIEKIEKIELEIKNKRKSLKNSP